jgi:hypothetical protein
VLPCFCSISDDIGVDLVKLSMLSAAVVPAFVPRLGDNKGMLPVRLKLTGAGGLPGSADIQVGCHSYTIKNSALLSQSGSNCSPFSIVLTLHTPQQRCMVGDTCSSCRFVLDV